MRAHKSPLRDMRDFFHGNVCDLTMRRWLTQEEPEPGWMAAHVDAFFEESIEIAKDTGDGIVRWRGGRDKEELREFCRELVTRLEPILVRYALPFTWQPAVRFSSPVTVEGRDGVMREVVLVGEMDLVVQDCEGRWVVWDLKATANNAYYRKVLGQLAFYALAMQARTGALPFRTGLIQPMCDEQVLPVTVDDQAIREMLGRIERAEHDIRNGLLAPKESYTGCAYCEVRHACSKFTRLGPPGQRMSFAA